MLNHDEVAARPSFPIRIYEDVCIQALEMNWDIGVAIYHCNSVSNPTDGKKVGVFPSRRRLRLQIC
jgi:hypothetical protein